MGLSLEQLDPPLDDIAFLARSANRVAALEALADAPRSRAELQEATGASQPTLGRILSQFEARGWIATDGSTHELTTLGELLAESFADLMASVETIQSLQGVASMLPADELDFDLNRLVDASLTVPSQADATAHVRREEALADAADRIQFFCNSAHPHTVRVYRDRVVEGGQTLDAVIAGAAIDAARADPEMAALVADLLAADGATIYRYEGSLPVMVGVLDGTTVIQPLNEAGGAAALIETDDPVVREWAEGMIEQYRAEAVELSGDPASDFTS